MHVDGDVLGDHLLHKRNEAFGDPAQHDARIRSSIDVDQIQNELRRSGDSSVHGASEELELRSRVAQHGCRCDVQLASDIGERGRLEAFRGEDTPSGVQEFLARNSRWPAHL